MNKFYSILAMMGIAMIGNYPATPYARRGVSEMPDSEESKKKAKKRIVMNQEKPWKGMKWFKDHGVWAINEKNAIRKSKMQA